MTDSTDTHAELAAMYDAQIDATSWAIQLALELRQFEVADRLNKKLQELYRRRAFLEIED
jgi:hypothetical protein